jgi:hypothetical protein
VTSSPGISGAGLYAKLQGKKPTLYERVRVMLEEGELFNGGTATDWRLFAADPSEVVKRMIQAAGADGVSLARLAKTSRLTSNRLRPILDELEREGAIDVAAVEGTLQCRARCGRS